MNLKTREYWHEASKDEYGEPDEVLEGSLQIHECWAAGCGESDEWGNESLVGGWDTDRYIGVFCFRHSLEWLADSDDHRVGG